VGGRASQIHLEKYTLANLQSGIGLMMAKALATNGASKVYIVGRREGMLLEAADFHSRYSVHKLHSS
jgi:NADP-dependent 3-hydroxy acid dehydrogenase YdfG